MENGPGAGPEIDPGGDPEPSRAPEDSSAPTVIDYGGAYRALAGAGGTGRTRAVLERMRDRHHTHSTMHYEASQMYRVAHRAFTIVIMTVSFATALAVSGVAAAGSLDESWTGFLSGGVLGLVGVLTAINEFLELQALEVKHREARAAHRGVGIYLDFVVARAADRAAGSEYDFGAVLGKIADIHRDIQAIEVDVPRRILARHSGEDTEDPRAAQK